LKRQRATDLKQNIVEGGKVEAVALANLARFMQELYAFGDKALIGLFDLLGRVKQKADMEAIGIRAHLLPHRLRVHQNEREAVLIGEHCKGFFVLLKQAEIKAALKKGACFGNVGNTEIEMVELHSILQKAEVWA